MIKDLGLFAWRIGLVLIIAMPLLYVTAALAPMAFNNSTSAPVVQFVLWLQVIVPGIFMTMAFGCALCLLVRIESHLRRNAAGAE
jgi:hypothetical protein